MTSLRNHLEQQTEYLTSGGLIGPHTVTQDARIRSPKHCRLSQRSNLHQVQHVLDNKASELGSRKNNKPLMEKKRRQRINKSLEELKKLITDPQRKESYSKLEKADILDMTVKFVRAISQNRISTDSQMALNYFLTGFSSCEQSTLTYLSASQPEATILPHLRGHLLRERDSTAHRFLHAKLTQLSPLRAHNYATPTPMASQLPPAPLIIQSSPVKSMGIRNNPGEDQITMVPGSCGKIVQTLCSPVDSLSSSCSSFTGSQSVWRPW